MTRAKLTQIAKVAMQQHHGDTYDKVANAIADAVEIFLKMEEESGEGIQTAPAPIGDMFDPRKMEFSTARLPSSPAVVISPPVVTNPIGTRESPRLVVMPDSPEAREKPIFPNHPEWDPARQLMETGRLVVSPDGESNAQTPGEKVHWRPEKISQVLHEKTPPTMKIVIEHPEKGDVPIKLERNIVIGAGFDSVKLSYKPVFLGDDMAVQATFSCTQKELPIGEELERIRAAALKMYAPRPSRISSSTPRNDNTSSYGELLRIGIDGGSV